MLVTASTVHKSCGPAPPCNLSYIYLTYRLLSGVQLMHAFIKLNSMWQSTAIDLQQVTTGQGWLQVTAGYKKLRLVTVSYIRLVLVTVGYNRIRLVTVCHSRLPQVTAGYSRLQQVTTGYSSNLRLVTVGLQQVTTDYTTTAAATGMYFFHDYIDETTMIPNPTQIMCLTPCRK